MSQKRQVRGSHFGTILKLVSLGAPLALAAPAFAQDDTVATVTAAYPVSGLQSLGAVPDSQTVHIALGLHLRNEAALDRFLAQAATPGSPLYGSSMSSTQFITRHAPSAASAQAVVRFLANHGFTNIQVAPNRLLVTADGPARSIRAAFRTSLRRYFVDGRIAFANTAGARVPRGLSGIVQSVLGLQTVDIAQPMYQVADASAQPLATTGHDPTEFPMIYHAGSAASGSQTTVGIISAGDLTDTLSDLAKFQSQNGLSGVPVQTVQVGSPGSDTSGRMEWDLDSQSILGTAGAVQKLIFYNGSSLANSQLLAAFNSVVSDNQAKVINVSLGECEFSARLSGFMASGDAVFKAATAQGQTFVVSSGDSGSNTGCNRLGTGLLRQVSYPASSPYVLAVGGTTLATSAGGDYLSEAAWSGSGGGASWFEALPSWQASSVSGRRRGVPDVAYDADPNSGALIVYGSLKRQVGGTSLSAPLMTATLARAQSANGNSLGFAAPTVYSIAAQVPSAFHDITSGNNGGYSATVGWDKTTGLGTPDIETFVGAF
jgi:pseudomonalisin/xanthomonalisin